MEKLPDLPSELLTLALADLEAVHRDPRYVVQMHTWHTPDYDKVQCAVCLAGAVIAKSLGALPCQYRGLFNFPREIQDKLVALDLFRGGSIWAGLERLGINPPGRLPRYLIVLDYTRAGHTRWVARMREVIEHLRFHNL